MAKTVIVELNNIQRGTLTVMARRAVQGLIPADVAANYKQNVINALVRHGALRPFHKGYKVNSVVIVGKAQPKSRTVSIDAVTA